MCADEINEAMEVEGEIDVGVNTTDDATSRDEDPSASTVDGDGVA